MRCQLTASLLLLAIACSEDTVQGPDPGPPPTGPPPEIRVTTGLGNAPVLGELQLFPIGSSTGWSYTVDFDGDGPIDREGVLERGLGFVYSYETPGIHRVRVRLERVDETVSQEAFVVVNDPAGIEILAQRELPGREFPVREVSYEGIAVDHAGGGVYAADFRNDLLYRLDPQDLSDLSEPLVVDGAPEGLAVAPSDSLLYIIHKRGPLTVVAIPDMQIRSEHRVTDGFFIETIDEFTVVVSGRDFAVLDTRTGARIAENFRGAWDIEIAPGGGRLAALDRFPMETITFYTLPDLSMERSIPLEDLEFAQTLAFHPDGDRLYVNGWNGEQAEIQVIDVATGQQLSSTRIQDSFSCRLCVANPTALSNDQRFLAFEGTSPALVIIDTELDLPLYHSTNSVGGAVAASPNESGVFYTLRGDGLVSKIRVRQ